MEEALTQNLQANYRENIDETVLTLRLSTKDHLDRIEEFLRSIEQVVSIDKKTGDLVPFDKPGIKSDITASFSDKRGTHRTVFQLMADKYLSEQYAPSEAEKIVGIRRF